MATKLTNKLTNWQKFDKAFELVSAYVVLDKETRQVVAKIALKFPKDGAGRLSCYMHIMGSDVQVGTASGYGYDKRTSAIIDAADHCLVNNIINNGKVDSRVSFIELLNTDKAQGGWQEVINEDYGFIVIQVV